MTVSTGTQSSEQHKRNNALQPTISSKPTNNRRYVAFIMPADTMQDFFECPFMALPLELRCLIYSYLSRRIYRRVFPPPGVCTWALYQMPTAILQVNRTMREDSRFLLKKLNNQRSPKVILGPVKTGMDALFALVPDIFHEGDNGTRLISLGLAAWYNDTGLSRQDPGGDVTSAIASQTECSADSLEPFVRHTLKRMELLHTHEISIRLLVRGWGDEEPPGPLEKYWMCYENDPFWNETRRALSAESARSVATVSRSSSYRFCLRKEIGIP